ncbi:uncharacterized protein [Littorina saxatilis]|uniref:uncharacterized protein isoform X2 n=1 Tax=Littorina saxatilis TaxID=31220 RepID=UPI0038B65C43
MQQSENVDEKNNNLMITTTDAPSTTSTPVTMFRITRVTKEELTDFYKVRVEYEASSKPTFVLLRPNLKGTGELLKNQDVGVVEFHVSKDTIQSEEDYPPMLSFSYPGLYFTAHLKLNNTPNSMEVPRITAQIAQGSDVIFQPGSDAVLDVTLKVEGYTNAIEDDYVHLRVIVKSDTEENRVDSYHPSLYSHSASGSPVWLDLVSDHGPKEDRHRTFRINSTLDDPRGILEVIAWFGFTCSKNCLLERLDSTATVRFYSADHSGPFPEGFLGFDNSQYPPDPSRVVCDVSRPDYCTIDCQVVGNDPSTAELTKILPNGDVMPTDDVAFSDGQRSRSQLRFDNITYADAGDFRCTAKSGSKEITMDISLVVLQSPRINKDLSQVTHFDNGSVAASCIAEGHPAPNVTFDSWSLGRSEDYDVTMTQLDESRTRADIIVINPDVASTLYSLSCRASNAGIDSVGYYSLHDAFYQLYVNN